MNKQSLVILLLILLISPLASGEILLNAPEGIVYDTLYNRYLVSNWNSGAVVAIDSLGVQTYFKTGLVHCSGMEIVDTVLYVCCNNQNLTAINLHNSETIFSLYLTTNGTHGVTEGPDGFLYVTSWGGDCVYKVDPSIPYASIFANTSMNQPVGIEYDSANSRLVVVSFGTVHDIQAIDITTGAVTTIITTTHPNMDDITMDNDDNFYISAWDDYHNWVYRYDNSFSAPPETLVYNDNHGLIDVCYNPTNHTLSHTDYWTNLVTCEQLDICIQQDTSYGYVPLPVNFTGSCTHDVSSWSWDLGNTETSDLQAVSTSYVTPGIYDVSLTAVTITDDTLTRLLERTVIALDDSLKTTSASAKAGEQVVLDISLNNNVPCSKICLPVEYIGMLNLTFDSLSTDGCRTESGMTVDFEHYDAFNRRFTVNVTPAAGTYLMPGDGLILKLYFTLSASALNTYETTIAIDGYISGPNTYLPEIESPLVFFNPHSLNGLISVNCCEGIRGNIDGDPLETIDISDLLYFVDYSFANPPGPEPVCMVEADVDGNDNVDVSDILYLVDYMFTIPAGPEPVGCD